MKSKTVWAIVTKAGNLAVLDGQCPIFWQRKVAQQALSEWMTPLESWNPRYHIEKRTVVKEAHRDRRPRRKQDRKHR